MKDEILDLLHNQSDWSDQGLSHLSGEILNLFTEKIKDAYNDGFGDTRHDFDIENYTS